MRWTREFAATFATRLERENGKITELQALHRQYPTAEMGLSDERHYSDTFYRAILVYHGTPLHIDFASWMDLEYAGISETRIVGLLQRCDVPLWILPDGAPFTMISYYTGRSLLSEDFRQTFFDKYEFIQKGDFYRV